MTRIKILWTFVAFLVFSSAIHAQSGNSTFTASVDATKVPLTGYFNLTYTLTNATGTSFSFPNVKKDFKILNGPSRQISTSLRNGVGSSVMKLTYVLQPLRQGKLTIGPAVIYADGTKMTSNDITIEAVKGKKQPAGPDTTLSIDEQAFVRIEADTTVAHIGQQIILDYKLYTVVNIQNYNIISESEYEGCFTTNIRTFNNRQRREMLDGVQYVTQIMKRVALFPQQNGVINIDPASIQLAVSTGKRRNSIFGGMQAKAHYTNTNALKINVVPIPQTPSANFTGAVGKFKMSAQHSASSVSTDQGVSIKLSIVGNGDMKRVSAPTIISPLAANGEPAFEIYDPTLKNDASYENGGQVQGRKDYEYLLLPKHPGTYQINPQFTYFDTDSSAYVTQTTYRFPVSVSQGKGIASDKTLTQESINKDHYRPHIANIQLSSPPTYLVQQPWYWALYGLPILGFLGFMGVQQYQASRGEVDLEALARKRAEKVARKNLAQAEGYMKSDDAPAFYKEISTAYLGYVHDKLSIKTSDLSKSNVASHLKSLNVSEDSVTQFVSVMNKTEMALYSGGASTEAMHTFYENAVDVVVRVEQEITSGV